MNLNELEDTHCEIRRTVDLQPSNLEYLSSSSDDEPSSPGSSAPYLTSTPLGGFLDSTTYAWLSSKSRLTVFNTKTGANISSWTFKHRITSVSQFPSPPGQIPLLLIGLDNDGSRLRDSSGLICIFDPSTSQVLRAIKTPSGVEQLCVITSGSETEDFTDSRLENILNDTSGLALVALRSLDHLVIDLRRSSWENLNLPRFDESNPAELDISDLGTRHRNKERHAVHNLMSTRVENYIGFRREEFDASVLPQDSLTTVLIAARKIGCLISGCLGRVIIWQNDGVIRWISPHLEESIFVSHLALLEPTDDPRPYCYLWVAYQDDSSAIPPVLRMYAMLFERKYSYKGVNQYFNLESDPSLKFEIELDEGTRLVSLSPVTRESNQETESGNKNGDESLLLISTEGKAFLFDLNQWYKEQMPRSVIECQNAEAILTMYSMKSEGATENSVVSCVYVPATLKEFAGVQTIPEEFFFPNSLSLEWSELGSMKVVTWLTRGVQAQLLREISVTGPVVMLHPTETVHRCISVGLIPSAGDTSFNSDPDAQRDLLLTLCLEQRWTTFLLRCVKSWSDGSAAYLFPAFIRWAVQRASTIKLTAHRLCIPLFDQSGSSIGEAEVKTLRSFSQQMECLSHVVENFSLESTSSTELEQQQRTLKRITIYLQVLLWFYDVGLLPESQELDEESLPISIVLRIPYPVEKLRQMYQQKREKCMRENVKKSEKEEDLFIDELIGRECSSLISQWEREGADANFDGRYPPPSLQSLLRSCLIDCYQEDSNEMDNKHQIIIYLLMDLAMLLQGSCPSVDQLVKYPGAFKLSPSLIKLTQALWLLDHEDYHGFLEIMTGQLVCDSDVRDWQHKLVIRTLIRSSQNKLALIYLRVRKPPLSSLEEQGTVISLSVEHGLLQSAFHRRPPSHYSQLLTRFFKSCNENGKLNDILHLAMDHEEEEAFVQFLEQEKCEETRLLYYLQRSRYNDAGSVPTGSLNKSGVPLRNNKSASLAVFSAYNDTLPEVTRKFATNFAKRTVQVDPEERFPRPLSHFKSRTRIQVLHEGIMRKARETFTRGDRLHVPFITEPSVSLRASVMNSEANCVMFLEKAPKAYGKRTREDMRDEDANTAGPRKRRRTDEHDGTRGDRLSLGMVFDTPHIKRKNQMRNAQTETPHSILKISKIQNVQHETTISPRISPQPSPTEEEREKRPRQIRFSLNQPRFEDSELSGTDAEQTGNEEEQSGTGMERAENESGQVGDDDSTKSLESSKDMEPEEQNDNRHAQTTILSNTSDITLPVASPRPRPSLRKTFTDSTNDLRRKSLIQSMMNRDSSLDSSKLSLDDSMGSGVFCSTLLNPGTPKTAKSHHATTILSSGSSIDSDFMPELPVQNNGAQVPRSSVGSSELSRHDSAEELQTEESDDSEHESESNSANTSLNTSVNNSINTVDCVVTCKTTTVTRTTVLKEFEGSDEGELDQNQAERVSEERAQSYHSMEVEERTVEESQEVVFSKQSIADQSEVPEKNDVFSTNSEEQAESQDDYDDEILALKFEDDDENDEVFESLQNSVNVTITETVPAQPQEPSPSKSKTAKFYEEFNITDDESIDESVFISKTNEVPEQKLPDVQELPEVPSEPHIRPESVNITDDESEPEEDQKSPGTPETDRNMNEKSLRTPEKAELPVLEENSTPQRMTRSRASSVAPINEPPSTPEAPRTPRTRRASSLVPELLSPAKASSSGSETTPTTPGKRGRGRRATSLMKEVLTSTIPVEPSISEVPARRTTRRGASVQKELPGTPTEMEKVVEQVPDEGTPKKRGGRAGSVAKEPSGTPRKTRGTLKEPKEEDVNEEETVQEVKPKRTRAGSVVKEVPEEVPVPRRTRAASVAKDTEEPTRTRKTSRTVSTSSDVPEEPNESVSVGRKTRGTSVAKETKPEPKEPAKNTRTRRLRTTSASSEPGDEDESIISKRTRGTSVAKDTEPEPVKNTRTRRLRTASASSEPGDEDESIISRKTRGTSVAKDTEPEPVKNTRTRRQRTTSASSELGDEEESVVPRRTRGTSVAKDEEQEVPKRTRRGSAAKDVDDVVPKRRRAGSVAKEEVPEEHEVPRRTRKGSVARDDPDEDEVPKRTRKGSVTKDVPEEDEVPRRRGTRGSSMSKDEEPDVPKRRGTRAASVSKDDEEVVRSTRRRGSVPKELPSEPLRKKRGGSIVKDVIPEENDDEEIYETKRTRNSSRIAEDVGESSSTRGRIHAIPEESEEREEQEGRRRRAMSVDQVEKKGARRKNEEDEVTEKKGRKPPARRKRAASESQDLEDVALIERTRRVGQAKQDNEEFQFAAPEEARGGPSKRFTSADHIPEFVFSPPATRSAASNHRK